MLKYKVSELANLVPLASEQEQEALKKDIEVNGQLEPVVLWRGNIVDGRCRQIACQELNIELKVRYLDFNLTKEEVVKIIKSLNTRRNLTITQKIISAVKYQQINGGTNSNVAQEWAISPMSLKNGKYIFKNAPEYIDKLFSGESIPIKYRGKDTLSSSVSSICKYIKEKIEADKLLVEDSNIEWSANSSITTEAGKRFYYEFVKEHSVKELPVRLAIAELANLKFKMK